ncbi:MAG: hypothetical protein DWQ51_15610 [Microcystis wesenbergii TW10]|uniref:Uncharacterized protein n=1 Tax=Microcystis wesenbergii TW10 TaxID=2060474 RepID=A0A3E0LTK1_9CHRO|nr:MAG: hypothetical protein DWQ51_15610 [Microcystis wesenbergii TW10]
MQECLLPRLNKQFKCAGSLAINLCVLCVFVVRSSRSPAGLYFRIHSNPREPSAFFSLLPPTPI